MTTPQCNPTELVAVILERRNGKDEIRFVPTCAGCGKLVFDLSQANVAVVSDAGFRPAESITTYKGAKVSRFEGRAFVFCWECDAKENDVPWAYAAITFRNHDAGRSGKPR